MTSSERNAPNALNATSLGRARARIERLCRELPDAITLFARLNGIIPAVVPVDGVCGLTLDPATLLHTGGYHEKGVPHSHLLRLLEIEYGEEDVNQFPELVRSDRTAAGLWQATRRRPHGSARYRDVYQPVGMGDELRVLLRDQRAVWGALILHRGGDRPPFTVEETAAVEALVSAVTQGLRRSYLRHDATVAGTEAPGAAGLLTFDPDGGLDRITAGGQWCLDQLGGAPSPTAAARISQPLLHMCAKARRTGEASVRVRGRSGRWLSLVATRVDKEGRVAVIIQPSHPEHTVGIMMEAYGLTPREQQVAQLVIYGMTDTEIAKRLTISTHTVRDHLKKVFDRTGTNGRSQLLHILYFAHYRPDIEAGRAMGTSGWFTAAGSDPTQPLR
ncbi:helix-turn-helix transcriptional regulator [Streptomyces roseicoloratus]|uniref:Helix-turn-helix transcriptional regulator n=1 Tax=Streptomyces roseicoloratus TaxID=2508722 RepID=A0ABY9RQU4_9ACTN|nr:helix-turn-helix transcriptional regulator [Streptomyces roseicoloratus]WMX43604.1 helix-turn-helix transcriptional regulator [Streptomyces roseicoloratus]